MTYTEQARAIDAAHVMTELLKAKNLAASYTRVLKRMRPGLSKRRVSVARQRTRARVRTLEHRLKTMLRPVGKSR